MVTASPVGHGVGHVKGPGKVSGRAQYTADLTLTGMLVGRCLRSPFAHAHIRSIDPTRDIPALSTLLLETRHGPAPYEGKAIGELSNVALPAAIVNAVYDAVGVRFTELPITAEKVYTALQAREGTGV
jgi:CO/xanthine dehydrogenase Mo-binding subunit